MLTEFDPHSDRIGRKRALERNGSVEPGEEDVRLVGIKRRIFELDEPPIVALEHHPFEAIGGDADKTLALFTLSIREIIRHAPDHVVPFLIEIPFGFEDSPADESIETAPHLGNATLKIERPELNSELLHQQLPKVRLHLVVTRTGGKMMQ